jgi:hypothetical protein
VDTGFNIQIEKIRAAKAYFGQLPPCSHAALTHAAHRPSCLVLSYTRPVLGERSADVGEVGAGGPVWARAAPPVSLTD